MLDENAFGLLISYYQIESDEYSLERQQFVQRYQSFRATTLECIEALPLGRQTRALDFGHALYLEVAQGEEVEDPFGWLRMVRARLHARDFLSVGVLSHGSRWVDEAASAWDPALQQVGDIPVLCASLPSEALRRALYADAAAREDENCPGWGPGLYVDTEAIEAMGRTLKNAPTPLLASGATFYRFGS